MADLMKPRKRYLYPCHYIRCDGAEIDFRTQENHTNDENVNFTKKRKRASSSNLDSSQYNSGFNPFNEDTQPNNNENIHTLFSSSPLLPNPSYFHVLAPNENKDNDEYIYYNEEEENDDDEDDGDEDDSDENDGDENDGDKDDGDENNGAENNGGEDEGDYNEEENDDDDDGDDEEEEEDIEEFFSSPKIDKSQFKNFPASLYLAKKMLNIFQLKMQLALCNNCHKLYNIRNIIEYKEEGKAAIANCLHKEFPNNPVPSRCNKCNNPLSILKKRKGEIIAIPRMIYPKPNIRQQLRNNLLKIPKKKYFYYFLSFEAYQKNFLQVNVQFISQEKFLLSLLIWRFQMEPIDGFET
ncbi:hypothetical protein GLOIN_2v1481451 [Rhizophagus irregularis DAOM 181602=DAOM 197198]|nr:hypothetical protein GLOIN_2v1481451 [Rhizophagus irregularis DAOM 181602=DAOM 197198]